MTRWYPLKWFGDLVPWRSPNQLLGLTQPTIWAHNFIELSPTDTLDLPPPIYI